MGIMDPRTFTLTEDHIKVLRCSIVRWNDAAYEGAVGVDLKRPYGNSSGVDRDIARILDWTLFIDGDGERHLTAEQSETAGRLHRETEQALQIVLAAGSFTPGLYRTSKSYTDDWTLAEDQP